MTLIRRLRALLAPFGMRVAGGFHPGEDGDGSGAPLLEDGRPARTLIMVGSAGRRMWRMFVNSRTPGPDPLDAWTRRVVGHVAGGLKARAVFPFDGPPWPPFQTWAMKSETLRRSPFGVLIHPTYGPWHAYRGALLFAERHPLPVRDDRPHPCDVCPDHPCIDACPAGALSRQGLDVEVCADHVEAPANECALAGCLARHACPVGRSYAYRPAQAAFHMDSFLERRRAAASRLPAAANSG